MKKVYLGSMIVMSITFLLSCNQADKPLTNNEQEIRELWDRFTNSICNGNWEEFSKSWDHSSKVSMIHPHFGEWLKGWEEIRPKYNQLLNSEFRCTLEKNELVLNISNSGDMAWGIIDMIVQLDDSAKTKNHPWQSVVFEKIHEEWKLVHLYSSLPKLEEK